MSNTENNRSMTEKEIQNFQRKLQNLCKLAAESGNTLTREQFQNTFGAGNLDEAGLIHVIQYLKAQGITISGELFSAEESGLEQTDAVAESETVEASDVMDALLEKASLNNAVPLTAKEEAYLKDHLAALPPVRLTDSEISGLFDALSKGDISARDPLVLAYMPVAARLAAKMNCSEILLQDLIGEADLLLLTLLSQPEPVRKSGRWLITSLRKGLLEVIDAESRQKASDEKLVERVRKLEDALLQLEEEDGTTNFTIEELTILLDMTEEELRDTLRLTGEDV